MEHGARIEEPNLGYKPSFKGGYFPVSPTDSYHDLRGETGHPLDREIYEMTPQEMREQGIRTTSGSLQEAIDARDHDRDFLTRGNVFTDDLIQTWIDYETEKELDPIRLRPHPYEFYLYYDN